MEEQKQEQQAQPQKLTIETLLEMHRKGEDISLYVGVGLASKIEEMAELEALDQYEAQMQLLMEELNIDIEAVQAQKLEQEKKVDDALAQLKSKMKPQNDTES
jgi:hypothetical protein